jgi:hypothetical protein
LSGVSAHEDGAPARAVFVVGMPRSGTTLLTRLLDGHPQLFVLAHETHATHMVGKADPAAQFLGETHYGRRLAADSPERARLESVLRGSLQGRSDLASVMRAAVDAARHVQQPPPGAEAWVEKTPRHVRDVPALLATFGPQTRVIGMVRDPRAVLASRREIFERTSRHHVRHFARRWATADALNHLYLAQHPREFLAVGYEELVSDVEPVMRRIAAHLQIEWNDVLLRPTAEGGDWQANSSFKGGETRAGTKVSTASVERWRKELSSDEIALVEQLLRGRMLAWSYLPDTPASRRAPLQRAIVELATRWYVAQYRRAWKLSAPADAPRAAAAARHG